MAVYGKLKSEVKMLFHEVITVYIQKRIGLPFFTLHFQNNITPYQLVRNRTDGNFDARVKMPHKFIYIRGVQCVIYT